MARTQHFDEYLGKFDPVYHIERVDEEPSLHVQCVCFDKIRHPCYRYHFIYTLTTMNKQYICMHFYCCSDECAEKEAASWMNWKWKTNPPPLITKRLTSQCHECKICGVKRTALVS